MPTKPSIDQQSIWVIMPAYNEEKYIEVVLKKALNYTDNLIFVDDGSTDKTFELAKKTAPHSLHHRVNLGKGAALKTGCDYAFGHLNAQAVIFMDSDDQHDPKELKLFIDALKDGHQLVFGVRPFAKNMPWYKVMANKFASYAVKALFGAWIPDIPSGYKAVTKEAYRKLDLKNPHYGVELEIAVKTAKYKLDFAEVPISTIYHDYDRGMTVIDALRILKDLIAWRITL